MDGSVVMAPSTSPDRTPTRKVEIKSINLALQGGGAHGAFTWGVLDRLLEDERIRFDGISATSAGAMNATALAAGMAAGGHEGAQKALAKFWHRISHRGIDEPAAADLIGTPARPSLDGAIGGLRLLRTDDAAVLAVRVQPAQLGTRCGRSCWTASTSTR